MSSILRIIWTCFCCIGLISLLPGCAGDSSQSSLNPFAPIEFKEGVTKMPLNPPHESSLLPFYVSNTAILKFAIDTDSISVGADGVTRYTVVLTNPNGDQRAQYEGIRCDTFQWKLYGNLENNVWREKPLSSWRAIQDNIPNRYQAALAQGAFCNMNIQIANTKSILKALDPKVFTGDVQHSNSNAVK